MKTKLTKIIMSSLAFACALVCLAVTMAPGTSTTARAAADGRVCNGTLKGLYLWTFDGYQNFGGNFVPKAIMQGLRFNGDGTTFNPFGTVNIGGTVIINATGGVGTYTVAADCKGTLSITGQYICRAGCTEGLDSRDLSQSCRPRSECRNGNTAAGAVKAP